MFIYFEVFFIDGRSRIRHKQVSWPLFKEPVYLEKSTKKPQSLRKTNAAKWKIEKRTAISGCRVQFFLYGRLLFTHALWRANCPSSLDWLMGPSFFFFFCFARNIYKSCTYPQSDSIACQVWWTQRYISSARFEKQSAERSATGATSINYFVWICDISPKSIALALAHPVW